MRISFVLVAALSAFGTAVSAQDDAAIERQKELEKCVTLDSDAARLACFDAVMAGGQEIDKKVLEARTKEKRENFGLSEQVVRERENEVRPAPVPDIEITSTVAAVRKEPSGSYTFALSNGQIWRTTNAGNLDHDLKRGDKLILKEGRFAGYRAFIEGRRGFFGIERVR